MEVVAQKRKRSACNGNRECRRVKATRHQSQGKHGHARDERDARRKSVESVDEVNDVGVCDEINHGDGVGEPSQVDELVSDGVDDDADDESSHYGNESCKNLAGDLLLGGELELVVKQTRQEDDRERKGQAPVVDVEVRCADYQLGRGAQGERPREVVPTEKLHGSGGNHARKDSDTAHARDRLCVNATRPRIVHGINAPSKSTC